MSMKSQVFLDKSKLNLGTHQLWSGDDFLAIRFLDLSACSLIGNLLLKNVQKDLANLYKHISACEC